jgi:hypothetical protein
MTGLPVPVDPDESGTTSIVLVKVAGRLVDAKRVTGCRTCQSPHRARIESWILEGYTRPTILRWLADLDTGELERPSEKSLRIHTEKHLPLEATARAAVIQRRAEQLGDDVERHGGRVADHLTALDTVITLGFDALVKGEITVDAATLMKAIDLKQKIDSVIEGGVDANVWREALMEYMRIAVPFIPEGRRAEFAKALTSSPVLAALSRSQQHT